MSGLAFHALILIILNHNPIHPELIRGSLIGYILAPGRWISLFAGARVFFIGSGFALAVDKYIIKSCVLGVGTVSPGPRRTIQINERHGYSPSGTGDVSLFLGE